jgi:hypothetical protein
LGSSLRGQAQDHRARQAGATKLVKTRPRNIRFAATADLSNWHIHCTAADLFQMTHAGVSSTHVLRRLK